MKDVLSQAGAIRGSISLGSAGASAATRLGVFCLKQEGAGLLIHQLLYVSC